MKKKLMISGALAALALAAGGVAVAQSHDGHRGGWGGPGGHGRGDMMAKADLNNDGRITKAEMRQAVSDRFAKMDVNKDGKITQEDRALARQQRQDAWFASADTDRNGQLSKAEFTAARDARAKARAERRGGPDGEGRGFGRGHGGGFGKFHGGRGFGGRGADADKDGAITLNEMTTRAMAMFDRIDNDKNGTVTEAERQAARDAMKAKWQERRAGRGMGADAPTN